MRVMAVLIVGLLVHAGVWPASSFADDFDFDALFDMESPATPSPEEVETEETLEAEQEASQPAVDEPAVPVAYTQEDAVEETEESVPSDETVDAVEAGEGTAEGIALQEELRRQASEREGLQSLDAGFRALDLDEYEQARRAFRSAIENIPDRPATADFRSRARWGLAESNYRIARQIHSEGGDLRVAKERLAETRTLSPNHRGLATLQRRIARDEARRLADRARPTPVAERSEIVEKRETIEELVEEGADLYNEGELERAELVFESILVRDPYHRTAMKYLRRIAEDRQIASSRLREATTAKMMQAVTDGWNPPFRADVLQPGADLRPSPTELVSPSRQLQEKMQSLIIPRIEFRQANIRDVVSFLRDASEAVDPDGEGVNIILNLSMPEGAAAPERPSDADPWGDADDWEAAAPAPRRDGGGVPSITLNLRRISLMEAIRYITEVAGLRYRIEDTAVVITPAGVADASRVVTRLYPVQPSFLDIVSGDEPAQQTGGFGEFGFGQQQQQTRRQPGAGRTTDVKSFFEGAGVPFPVGTSITYNPTISQLIVANTPENLERFERILSQLNVVPNQVEIEARFVEVAEEDMQELGLQWIFTDNYTFAQRRGQGPFGGGERVQMDAGNVSSGLRFFSAGDQEAIPASIGGSAEPPPFVGNILSVSSILTNPELRVVLHALSQNGNVDVLSAPRVTTRSGVNATIQVVTEIIYPTEFRVTEPTVAASASGGGGLVTPPTVTPDNFETRGTGVILNVTPTVGPDGYTIDLSLAPEVSELIDWIQYGSRISIPSFDPATNSVEMRDFTYNIPQPVFASRNVTTSIVIWDGQTVVMGGLMRERLISYKDKIPILGDIPILGRLFRSEGTTTRKENLLIFVTARLVDPAGKPIHQETRAVGAEAAPQVN